ncbi:MAG: hypothetical protein ACLTG4_05690 [Oscillospiraceae bacterium]
MLLVISLLLLPCIVAVIYGEPELWVLLVTAAGGACSAGFILAAEAPP